MTTELLILRGLPASGKSTFARTLTGYKRVNKDELRAMLWGGNYTHSPENESVIHSVNNDLVLRFLRAAQNVVVDNTNLRDSGIKELHRLAASVGDVDVNELVFDVPFVECMRRNEARMGSAHVPEEAMKRMKQQVPSNFTDKTTYYPKLANSGEYFNDPELFDAVICDIDGTFSFIGDRSPYDASKSDETDKPNEAVLSVLHAMDHSTAARIIFVSAREEKDREATERLIQKYLSVSVPYLLYMRPTGDFRRDSVVKKELFYQHIADKYYVNFVLDDRPQVVRMWRYELGLPVFQVNDKEF